MGIGVLKLIQLADTPIIELIWPFSGKEIFWGKGNFGPGNILTLNISDLKFKNRSLFDQEIHSKGFNHLGFVVRVGGKGCASDFFMFYTVNKCKYKKIFK